MESQILAKDPELESETRASLLGHSRQRGFPVRSCQFSTNLRFYGVTPGGEADEHAPRRRNTGFGELVTFRGHDDEVVPGPEEDIASSLQGCLLQTKP